MSKKQETIKIRPGFRLGKLTVANDSGQRKNGYTIWQCTCDCGASILLDSRCLKRGTIRDCGCNTNVKPGQKDLTGQRFGRLTVLEPTEDRDRNGSVIWRCKCDCGQTVTAVSSQLTKGYKKSCGCLSHPPLKAYEGQRFGRLIVTEYAGKRDGMHRWKCICDCGNTTVVGQTLLQSGKTKSCGCLQSEILRENLKLSEGTSVTVLERTEKRLVSRNTSGYNGVYFNKKIQKWVAQITFKRKNYYLGAYTDIKDAVSIRKKAEERVYGEFLEWYYAQNPRKQK